MRPDYNMDELRNRYPDDDFFAQEGNGAAMSYPNENAFRAWATQYNEVTIHNALALRSISYRLIILPGLLPQPLPNQIIYIPDQ